MNRALALALLALVLAAGLSGCYEDPGVTMFEPHQYKGKNDPLLAKLQQGGLQAELQTRFQQVQTDR